MPAEIDISTDLCGVRLQNPLVLASGILGTSATLLEKAASLGAGAVTAKSAGPQPRKGHANPIIADHIKPTTFKQFVDYPMFFSCCGPNS